MTDNFQDKIIVGLEERSYPIYIGPGILSDVPEMLSDINFPSSVVVVSNETVFSLYGEEVVSILEGIGSSVTVVSINDGEQYKTLETLSRIYDELVAGNIDRSSGIIALGGGVVGDIAGFAAATYLRGIDYLQIPTTLLAQVDSSVGGKTAVNHSHGKNLIGAFNQPKLVCIDIGLLQSLPEREYLAGIAEVIKYGIIRDYDFFVWLKKNRNALLAKEPEALVHAIKTSCQIKSDIVEIDEKESSLRAILNYGHTFGHAVEALTDYRDYLHGEAVAIGMVVAAKCSESRGYCSASDVNEIKELLVAYGLPVEIPEYPLSDYLDAMMHDKKVKSGTLNMVLNQGVGSCVVEAITSPEALLKDIVR